MINYIFVVSILAFVFLLQLFSVIMGRHFGLWKIAHDTKHRLHIITVTEGAVFALLGLLIAFSFTGAYERFENREISIIDEVNAIHTLSMRIELLDKSTQNGLQRALKEYVDSRVAIYKHLTDIKSDNKEIEYSIQRAKEFWELGLVALKITNNLAATQLFVPALNNLFEIAHTRLAITKIHPPAAVFVLLIGLAMLSSFLAGYSTASKTSYNFLYLLSYIAITTFTIYIIIDLEFPRLGMIRLDRFDNMLVEVSTEIDKKISS